MKQKLYVHLGVHKTASSLLQKHLRMNSRVLERLGVSYVNLQGTSTREQLMKKLQILFKISSKTDNYLKTDEFRDFTEFLPKLIINRDSDTYIISDERIMGSMLGYTRVLYPFAPVVAKAFCAAFQDLFDLRFLIYIRNHDTFIESAYLQYLREGHFIKPKEYLARIDLLGLSWKSVVDSFSNEVGEEKVFLRTYEYINTGVKSFVYDYLNIFKKIDQDLKIKGAVINPKFSAKAMEMFIANAPEMNKKERHNYQIELKKNYPEPQYQRANILSIEEREKFKSLYFAEHISLCKKFGLNKEHWGSNMHSLP